MQRRVSCKCTTRKVNGGCDEYQFFKKYVAAMRIILENKFQKNKIRDI